MRKTLFLLGIVAASFQAATFQQAIAEGVVGEAFGKPVTDDEFAYHYKTARLFSRSGKEQPTEEETRQEAWQNLILLKEADRLGVKVSREELKAELTRLVSQKGIEYDTLIYRTWVRVTFADEVQQFERRLEDLLRITKLIQDKMQPQVSVSDEEIQEKYLNQYSSFESEYIHFDTPEEAREFQKAVTKEPRLWKETFDRKKSASAQKGAAWINVMSVEALIDLWKIPQEDVQRILQANPGDFIVAKNYYGDCVLRPLFKRQASLQDLDDKKKQAYRNELTTMKRQQGAKGYFDDLLKRAGYKDYEKEKRQAQEKATRSATIEKLKEKTIVQLETTQGLIEMKLFPEVAPKACENFVTLVERGFYNGLLFHRVKKGFMIQGGDPTGTGTGGESIWGEPFEDELSDQLTFDRPGLLGMANSGPKMNKSQFFITTVPTPWLNKKHTIFGEVVSGMEVVKQIESSPTNEQDRPLEDRKILKAFIKPPQKEKKE